MNSDREWERWGLQDPYFGVLTHEKYRRSNLSEGSLAEFFESGRLHVQYVLGIYRQYIDPTFVPERVLDFGCGVGRVLVPFAAEASEVTGVDVSSSMLDEARRNCAERNITNVSLALSDDLLSAVHGTFDLVHTCIVLQHIAVERGRSLFTRLVERVQPGGAGALHITFAWDIHAKTFGQVPKDPEPRSKGPVEKLKAYARAVLGRSPPPRSPTSEVSDPEMRMHFYNLNELLFILHQSGVHRVHTEVTDHGGVLGAFLFFRKPV